MEAEEPYDCCWCKKKNMQDVMVTAGVVSRYEAICSDCKVKFGQKMFGLYKEDGSKVDCEPKNTPLI